MRTLSELESILTTYSSGPILPVAAKELLLKYKALRTAYVADTDGLDPDEAERKYLKEAKKA